MSYNQKRNTYDEAVSSIGSKLGNYVAIIIEDPGTKAASESINPSFVFKQQLRSFTVKVIQVKNVELDPQGVIGVMFNGDPSLLFSPRDLLRKANDFDQRMDVSALGNNGKDFIETITRSVYDTPEDAVEVCTRLNQVYISQLETAIVEYELLRDQMQDINRATTSMVK